MTIFKFFGELFRIRFRLHVRHAMPKTLRKMKRKLLVQKPPFHNHFKISHNKHLEEEALLLHSDL